MKERPILFSGFEVRAIRDGRKTQARRIMKNAHFGTGSMKSSPVHRRETWRGQCPYGQPGDRLWVRETWMPYDCMTQWSDENGILADDCDYALCFKADDDGESVKWVTAPKGCRAWGTTQTKWKPAIHMPRWASRITLEITSIRAERLQDISEADALAEGVSMDAEAMAASMSTHPASLAYSALWESINGPGSWAANPWVWAIEFQPIKN